MSFWNRRRDELDDVSVPSAPLEPKQFLALVDDLGRACATEVGRLGGDRQQVLGTIWLAEAQSVTRVQLTSDGTPVMTGKAFLRALDRQAVPLRAQPPGRLLERIEVTVAGGRLRTQVTYRD